MAAGPDTPDADPLDAFLFELRQLRSAILSQPAATSDQIVERLWPYLRRLESCAAALR